MADRADTSDTSGTTESGGRTIARVVRAEVVLGRVSVPGLAAAVEDRAAGAVVTFDGVVRDHDRGREVTAIAYSAHPSADEVIVRIAREAAEQSGLRAVAVVHRIGELGVGDTALGVAVSADHRAPAFEAVRDIVEEIKKRLPVWKHQLFADGTREWSGCA